jgi:hypothetical protein
MHASKGAIDALNRQIEQEKAEATAPADATAAPAAN